ncbi:MAG: HAD family hydrolase [Chitinispirillaceae bacterium]|nr:HAD family hydrolase [Chitinispirillaceae bacterium]
MLHETGPRTVSRTLVPVAYESNHERLGDIRAAIFDVYGTLINYWRPGLQDREKRPELFTDACRETARRFTFTPYLEKMDPAARPEKTLYDLYCGLIALQHEQAVKKGTAYPEMKIEGIWQVILLMLKRYGYEPRAHIDAAESDWGRHVAFTYNFFSLGRTLYPGVVDALEKLRDNSITLGIVSNAQFYTPIDLTLLIRDQSRGAYDDMNELFDPDLTFYSYEYNVAKPDTLLFKKLFEALYEYRILPSQTVFVGNDLAIDIEPAAAAGMKTAFFTGDRESTYFHGKQGSVTPDIVFDSWDRLPGKLSFHSQGNGSL